jgi:4-amino-4-deoxy-L-arabinose transferase-like glycosyltransferase
MRLRIAISLVLGLVTTWVIAVVLASLVPETVMINGAAAAKPPTWAFRQWRSFGRVSSNYSPAFDPRVITGYEGPKPLLVSWWSRMHTPPDRADYDDESLGVLWFNETAVGWPVATFMSDTKYDGRIKGGTYIVWERGSLEFERTSWTLVLPYQPVWRGFLFTVLVVSGVWFALVSVPGAWRRRRRRGRGLCERCGYDMHGGGSVCPECGTAWRS